MTWKRTPDLSKPLWIHRNLHSKCWSVCQNGLVVAHTTRATLTNCRFVVRPGGYKRFCKTGARNVHAFIVGNYTSSKSTPFTRVSYNPHNGPSFTADRKPVSGARKVVFTDTGAFGSGLY